MRDREGPIPCSPFSAEAGDTIAPHMSWKTSKIKYEYRAFETLSKLNALVGELSIVWERKSNILTIRITLRDYSPIARLFPIQRNLLLRSQACENEERL